MAPIEEDEEKKHFVRILTAFRNYNHDAKERLHGSMEYFKRIPTKHKSLLKSSGFESHLKNVENCIDVNSGVIKEIIDGVERMFENQTHDQNTSDKDKECAKKRTAPMDIEKVHSTLKSFVRDWSSDGKAERDQCYKPILNEIDRIFGHLNTAQRSSTNILVPGAGLGRLAFDIASQGYVCQGNEFSLFMLIASNYVLNRCKSRNSCTIYPWIHQYTNNLAVEDQIKPVTFPDIDPAQDMPKDANFSMVAGDFLEVYSDDDFVSSQDCVVTSFFIDCAHNVVEFIELIHRILKPGGTWINFGPLLYHFADVPRESSIEPSYDIVRNIIEQTGFEFLREEKDCVATYCQNPKSMLQYTYKCVYFTCAKK